MKYGENRIFESFQMKYEKRKMKLEQNMCKFILKKRGKNPNVNSANNSSTKISVENYLLDGGRKSLENFILVRFTIFYQTSTNSSICEGSENNNRNQ